MAGNWNSGGRAPPPAKPGPGRPKGSKDKIGRQCKENIIAVFDAIGGIKAMATWARRNKGEFYKLYARLIPNYVQATVNVRDASELTDGELVSIITGPGSRGVAGAQTGEAEPHELH
jgi:hypothetical protein